MILTTEQFAKAIPHARPSDRVVFLGPFNEAFRKWGIDAKLEAAHFLAQAAHESQSLRALEENLRYTTAERVVAMFGRRAGSDPASLLLNPQRLANRVYANRNGNGDEASGDGWRYRGRGIGHLTGLANYRAYGEASGYPVVESPGMVTSPVVAVDSFAWFWVANGCPLHARKDDLGAVSGIVNRGDPQKTAAGLEGRRLRLLEVKAALGV